jgi:hypothetical protein
MAPDTAEVTEVGSRIPTWPQIPPKFTRHSHLSVDATANHLCFRLWKQRPRGFDSHRPLHFSSSAVSLYCPRTRRS